jgi:hypothetical protein
MRVPRILTVLWLLSAAVEGACSVDDVVDCSTCSSERRDFADIFDAERARFGSERDSVVPMILARPVAAELARLEVESASDGGLGFGFLREGMAAS